MKILFLFLLAISGISYGDPPPNIIVIVSDDLGYNDVSWHNPRVISPHMGELAEQGIILEQHYSQAVCSPTRGALLTGRYPIHMGLHNGVVLPKAPHGLDTQFSMLPEQLKQANYSTQIVGKWHLGFCNEKFWPTNRGFDYHYGFLLGGETYFDHSRMGGYDFRENFDVDFEANGTYSTKLFQDKAIEVIEKHDKNQPLFLYLPFQSVHGPLEVPQEYADMYSDIDDEERRVYLGMVTALDDAIGNITDSLKTNNLYENSIIIYFSDNGGPQEGWPPGHDTAYAASNWPLRGGKMTLWEGGTRTTAFIHSPKYLTPRTENGLIHVTDWFPTILSAAGVETTSQGMDGIDQWSYLQDPQLDPAREEMIYNIGYPDWAGGHLLSPISAIRMGEWKYIWRQFGYAGWGCPAENNCTVRQSLGDKIDWPIENNYHRLYNLALDPEEREDLSAVEPERAEAMLNRLNEYLPGVLNVTYPAETEDGDPSNFGGFWSAGWC